MGRSDDAVTATAQPTEEQVAAYLRAHPDFLVRHPEVAVRLAAPKRQHGEGVADLQQFMIDRLRQELDQMRGCAEHLISTTRSNMSTQARTHAAALSVLGAKGMAELTQILTDLAPQLEVEVVALAFETAGEVIPELAAPGLHRMPQGHLFDALEAEGREVVLRAATPGDAAVFGDAAGLVRSSALVRIPPGERRPPGVLALGSRHDRTFHPGQGTELLVFLARVIHYAVSRWVR